MTRNEMSDTTLNIDVFLENTWQYAISNNSYSSIRLENSVFFIRMLDEMNSNKMPVK